MWFGRSVFLTYGTACVAMALGVSAWAFLASAAALVACEAFIQRKGA